MLGRIYYLYILLYVGGHGNRSNRRVILFVYLVSEESDKVACLFSADSLYRERILDLSDLGYYLIVKLGNELTASLVVKLIAVVLGGIVRGGYHNAAKSAKLTNCKRKLGSRTK